MTETSRTWKYELALLGVVLIWGLNFPVVKGALRYMSPFAFNAFRFTLSVGLMAIPFYASWRKTSPGRRSFLRQRWKTLLGLGLLGHVAYQVLFISGVHRTTSGNAALIMAGAPLWTALCGHLLHIERLRSLAWGGLLLSLTGTALVVIAGPADVRFTQETLTGNMIMLLASTSWGAYTALSKPVLRRITPIELTFLTMATAPPILWLLALPEMATLPWSSIPLWVWLAIVFSGALSTGIAYMIWNSAIRQVGASHTAVFGNLVPFISLAGGYILLGEPVALMQILGGGLIIGGLLLMRRARSPQTPTTS